MLALPLFSDFIQRYSLRFLANVSRAPDSYLPSYLVKSVARGETLHSLYQSSQAGARCSWILIKEMAYVQPWLRNGFSDLAEMPLSIVYACSHFTSESSPPPTVLAILHAIARYAERWSCIGFDLPYLYYDTLQSVKGRLPNIEYISFANLRWNPHEITTDLDMFSVAPQLRNLCVDGYDPQSCKVVLPTDQLTKLIMDCNYINDGMDLLQRCPHVIHCAFGGLTTWDIEVHVWAAQLQSLKLSFAERNITTEVFDCLTIPAIRQLSCSSFDLPDQFPCTSFSSLISRSSCSLQTLFLQNFHISDIDFIECLRAVPSLCELSITDMDISNEVFRMLDPSYRPDTDASGSVLPNLNTFAYTGRLDLDFVVLANFLRSRWEREEPLNVSLLESIEISTRSAGTPDPALLIFFQKLAQQGMAINLTTRNGSWP